MVCLAGKLFAMEPECRGTGTFNALREKARSAKLSRDPRLVRSERLPASRAKTGTAVKVHPVAPPTTPVSIFFCSKVDTHVRI
jgi:hypothetical protein